MVIGIQSEGTISGMKVIGLGRHTRALDGYHLATMESSSLWVTGMEIAADLNMTITGIGNETEIMIGTAKTITSDA
jgi:hypothetical protein